MQSNVRIASLLVRTSPRSLLKHNEGDSPTKSKSGCCSTSQLGKQASAAMVVHVNITENALARLIAVLRKQSWDRGRVYHCMQITGYHIYNIPWIKDLNFMKILTSKMSRRDNRDL